MTGLTRFSQDMDGSMEPDEDGPWVRYEDVAAPVAPVGDKPATSEPVGYIDPETLAKLKPGSWISAVIIDAPATGCTAPLYTAPPDVQPGWVLVPVEPTAEMVSAACAASGDSIASRPVWKLSEDVQAAHSYRAMLAAAPKAPT